MMWDARVNSKPHSRSSPRRCISHLTSHAVNPSFILFPFLPSPIIPTGFSFYRPLRHLHGNLRRSDVFVLLLLVRATLCRVSFGVSELTYTYFRISTLSPCSFPSFVILDQQSLRTIHDAQKWRIMTDCDLFLIL